MRHATVIDLLEEAERCPSWIEGLNEMADERRARGESRYSFPIQRRPPGPRSGFVGLQPQSTPAGALFTLGIEDEGKEEG